MGQRHGGWKKKEREEMEVKQKEGKHFVLIHGACHGAWCWYKVKPLLEKAGHRVTALDMAASGIHPTPIHELHTFLEYSQPLIDFLNTISDDDDQKVILVGHSLGGLNLVAAMELVPHKIETAVFLTALLLDTHHNPSFVIEKFVARPLEQGIMSDTEVKYLGEPEKSMDIMLFGPKFLSALYHLCPQEDLELAMLLMRPSSFFLHDFRKAKNYSEEKRKGTRLVYVVCEEDRGVAKDFQLWMAENAGVKEVKMLEGTDHMPMISKPHKLRDCLLEIVKT